MPFPQLTPPDRRVAAGVCGGIADAIGVDPTLVRLVFALLALAGARESSSMWRPGSR
jgi:phage shock protein PspC (stress-responsive transcriptional regulator)